MKIIGLVGGSGAGKGAVTELFKKYNIASIDTDAVYHELISAPSECTEELKKAFGDKIIKSDGSVDRRALAETVFADGAEKKREVLNFIAHRFVLDEVRRLIPVLEKMGYAAVLVDAPLLFESGFDKECDSILCVTARKDVRIERIIQRDGITREMALSRIAYQKTDDELISRSDFLVENNGDMDALKESVGRVVSSILNKGDKING